MLGFCSIKVGGMADTFRCPFMGRPSFARMVVYAVVMSPRASSIATYLRTVFSLMPTAFPIFR